MKTKVVASLFLLIFTSVQAGIFSIFRLIGKAKSNNDDGKEVSVISQQQEVIKSLIEENGILRQDIANLKQLFLHQKKSNVDMKSTLRELKDTLNTIELSHSTEINNIRTSLLNQYNENVLKLNETLSYKYDADLSAVTQSLQSKVTEEVNRIKLELKSQADENLARANLQISNLQLEVSQKEQLKESLKAAEDSLRKLKSIQFNELESLKASLRAAQSQSQLSQQTDETEEAHPELSTGTYSSNSNRNSSELTKSSSERNSKTNLPRSSTIVGTSRSSGVGRGNGRSHSKGGRK